MTSYVFVGAFSQALDQNIKLARFGQRVELPEEIAADTKHPRGLPCIPAEDFDKIGFTAEELKKYGVAETHDRAPEEFLAKKRQALEILHSIRYEVK